LNYRSNKDKRYFILSLPITLQQLSPFFVPLLSSRTSCNTSPSQLITQMQRTFPGRWIESSSRGSGPLKKSINRKPLHSVFGHQSSSLLTLQKLSAICLPFSLIQCRTETQNRNHFFSLSGAKANFKKIHHISLG